MELRFKNYVATLSRVLDETRASGLAGEQIKLGEALEWAASTSRSTHDAGNKIMFIGNGGSAGIASHMAIDNTKNGNMRAQAFNDGAALTCLGNDLGYENVFAKQIEMHGRSGDLLVAISSSGSSQNILNGVKAARTINCRVLTLSGFSAANPLRQVGDVNLYTESSEYGFVEIAHLGLCHAILDLALGWGDAK